MRLFAADQIDSTTVVWTALFSLLGTIFTGVMAYFMAKLNSKTNDLLNETIASKLLRARAEFTHLPADDIAAKVAEKLLKELLGIKNGHSTTTNTGGEDAKHQV